MAKIMTLLLIFILYGCSGLQLSSTRTQEVVDKISPATITVTFCGNAYMSQIEVEKYALQRACREALSKGFSHFRIVDKNDQSKLCVLMPEINKQYSGNTLPAEDITSLTSAEFVEPNVTLMIQGIPEGQKIPVDAIDAAKYLQENFPGLVNQQEK